MSKKVLLTATVQSHICQFHKPLADVLHKKGYEVHVAARNNLAEKNGLQLDFADKVYDVPFARSPKSLDNLRAFKQLKKIIDNGGYEVIHCNTPMGGIVTRLAAVSARRRGAKVYYTAHGFHFYKGAPKKNWLFFYPIELLFSWLTDKVITITDEDYQLAKKKFFCRAYRIHGVGVDEKRYCAVDETEKLRIKAEMGYKPDQKIILCVGELLPNKNQTMAIHMMKKVVRVYPDAMLLLAGNGPEKDALEKEIKRCGLSDNVRLLGYVTNLQDYQHIADVSVSCSKREGLPLNIVEAMLSGTPVVASYNRGHRELIRDGETGYLIDVNNVDSMAERVIESLNNEKSAAKISDKAKCFALNYGFDSVKKELNRIYPYNKKLCFKPIRVLCVFSLLGRGGAETMCMNIYRNLDRNKVQFDFVRHGDAIGAYEEEIISLGGRIYTAPVYKVYNHIQYCNWWKKHLKDHPEHQIIHGHYYTLAGIYLKIAGAMGRTTIAHSHNTKTDNFIKKYLISKIEDNSEYHLACSEEAGRWMFPNSSYKVIKNAIDSKQFILSNKNKIYEELEITDKLVIGHVGRFNVEKNHDFLIDVFKIIHDKNPKSVLLLVGIGPTEQIIRNKVLKLGISDSVIFLGTRDDIPDILSTVDALVFPSLFEGLPVVIIESQAAGLKCFLSNRITREVDITGRCTFLPIEDPYIWANKILSENLSRVDTSEAVRKAGYDIHTTVKWLEDFYNKIAEKVK